MSTCQGHLANKAACWGMAAIWVLGEQPGVWAAGILSLGRDLAWNWGASCLQGHILFSRDNRGGRSSSGQWEASGICGYGFRAWEAGSELLGWGPPHHRAPQTTSLGPGLSGSGGDEQHANLCKGELPKTSKDWGVTGCTGFPRSAVNKSSRPRWLKTTDIYSLTVLEAESPNSGVRGARLPPEAPEEDPTWPFPAPGGSRWSLACGRTPPDSARLHTAIPSMCLRPLPRLIRTLVTELRAYPCNPGSPHLKTRHPRPLFQSMSHSEGPAFNTDPSFGRHHSPHYAGCPPLEGSLPP